jgi:HAD superfamily hydrolase (TIGR01509 family)
MTEKAVILDMDGVLVDSIPMHKKAMDRIFKKHNIPFSISRWDEINGKNIPDTFRYIKDNYGGDFDLYEAIEEKKESNMEIAKKISLFKGIDDAIKRLRQKGYILILATSALKKEAYTILDRHNLRVYFDCIVTGDDVRRSKPDPEIFEKCADRLKLERESCVVVEDSPNGIEAAKKAGMKVIGVTTTHDKEELKEADLVIDKPSKLTGSAKVVLDE